MNLDHLAQLATEATPGEVSATPAYDGYVDEFYSAVDPETVLALVDVARAAQGLGLETVCLSEPPCGGCRACSFRDALAKLDNLGGTE